MRRRRWVSRAAVAALVVLVVAGCAKDDPAPTTLVLGDSLTVGAEMGGLGDDGTIEVDAFGGRTTLQGVEQARDVDARSYEQVIVALGTNDYLDSEADFRARIDKMMKVLGTDVPVTWINVDTGTPKLAPAASGVNAALTAAADDYDNLTIADWAGYMATVDSPDELRADDEVHYSPEGYRRRARWMADLT